jgi:hypothetical protein
MIQKPQITKIEIDQINKLISENPSWGRTRLSIELCNLWGWNHHDGRPKEISCRDMLRRLDGKKLIILPAKLSNSGTRKGIKNQVQSILHDTSEILGDIRGILPVRIEVVKERTHQGEMFKSLIAQYHYLGFDMTIGENLKYNIYSKQGDLLACLLFGSSAWACAPRDKFIGWDTSNRRNNLNYTTNNTRFLVLPWVKVPHLASHILGHITRRISSDWQTKYGHPVYSLETFVEKERFKGTCYKAANWKCVGETKGRSRNDRYTNMSVPIKDIYLYPLCRNFREVLNCETHL